MEIKRKVEFLLVTNEKFIVRKSTEFRQTACAKCGEAMLTIEQTANLLGIKQRRIFQIIEMEATHYTETEAGALMICPTSLAAVLDFEPRKNNQEINES